MFVTPNEVLITPIANTISFIAKYSFCGLNLPLIFSSLLSYKTPLFYRILASHKYKNTYIWEYTYFPSYCGPPLSLVRAVTCCHVLLSSPRFTMFFICTVTAMVKFLTVSNSGMASTAIMFAYPPALSHVNPILQ